MFAEALKGLTHYQSVMSNKQFAKVKIQFLQLIRATRLSLFESEMRRNISFEVPYQGETVPSVESKLHDHKKATDERPMPYPDVRRVGETREEEDQIKLRELEREQAEKEVRVLVVLKREDEKRIPLPPRPPERWRGQAKKEISFPERVEERNPHLALRQEAQQQLHRVVDRLNEINDEEEVLTRQLEELEARVAAARLLETNN